ncbi:LysR family transcriptional regulator [Streptacidiphilus cavernicola]|uniref:LysR family transcriptional regulator n=1 Tax=Streptacidiphilus cavernicola TaxID=3342716 RepID=A0ABV6VSU6_9ACTN
MQLPDLNLLPALDALLRAGSVAGAAAELNVSASAMSRTLGRLRRVVGDPLLVPSGRGLQLTPRARELQPQVQAALASALTALRPPAGVELATLEREFTIRTNDGVASVLGPALAARCAAEAPGIRLRLLPEGDEDPVDLRRDIDLDVGALPPLPPDVCSRDLVEYRYLAVARADAWYAGEPLTAERFAALPHITTSRRGRVHSVVDQRLAELDLRRDVLATVPTYGAACWFALESDALALVPDGVAAQAARHLPLAVLDIPLDLPPVRLGMAWQLRLDADPAHRWLRATLAEIAADGGGGAGDGDGAGDGA